MQRPVPPVAPGLELRPAAGGARFVARNDVVLGVVTAQRRRRATAWCWWTPQSSGTALSLPAALARVAAARAAP